MRGPRPHWRDRKLIKTHPSLSRIWVINVVRNALRRKSNALRSHLASSFQALGERASEELPNPVFKAELCMSADALPPLGRARATMIIIFTS